MVERVKKRILRPVIDGVRAIATWEVVARENAYDRARSKALALLDSPFRLGGVKPASREDLHDRKRGA